jgi:hypothetical protein
MDRVRFITHQGKQILLVDLTDCNAEEVTTIVGEVPRIGNPAHSEERTIHVGEGRRTSCLKLLTT